MSCGGRRRSFLAAFFALRNSAGKYNSSWGKTPFLAMLAVSSSREHDRYLSFQRRQSLTAEVGIQQHQAIGKIDHKQVIEQYNCDDSY